MAKGQQRCPDSVVCNRVWTKTDPMGFKISNLFTFVYKAIVDVIIFAVILAAVLTFLPNNVFPNLPMSPTGYEVDHIPEKLDNWNNLLAQRSQYLLKDVIVGPESMVEKDDFIYTGLADGRLVEVNKITLKVRDITRFGTKTNCGN